MFKFLVTQNSDKAISLLQEENKSENFTKRVYAESDFSHNETVMRLEIQLHHKEITTKGYATQQFTLLATTPRMLWL